MNQEEKYMFGLANKKFTSFLAKSDPTTDKSGNQWLQKPKYSSKQYRLSKLKTRSESKKNIIYGEISSSLRLIETILRLKVEGSLNLL